MEVSPNDKKCDFKALCFILLAKLQQTVVETRFLLPHPFTLGWRRKCSLDSHSNQEVKQENLSPYAGSPPTWAANLLLIRAVQELIRLKLTTIRVEEVRVVPLINSLPGD